MTALENVMLPLELAGAPAAARARRMARPRRPLPADRRTIRSSCPGGEQQRVAIARAFAGEPKLLLADEPTGNLDAATGAEVADLMFRLNRERGTTLVLATHAPRSPSRCAPRKLSLASGRLVADERAYAAGRERAGV